MIIKVKDLTVPQIKAICESKPEPVFEYEYRCEGCKIRSWCHNDPQDWINLDTEVEI